MSSSSQDYDLAREAQRVLSLLQERQPLHVDGLPPEVVGELPPHMEEELWEYLGDALEAAEDASCSSIPADRWISLRCNGRNFSKLTSDLRQLGVLQPGFSQPFARIMVECCHTLVRRFGAKCGFTQLDEITVLIPPAGGGMRDGKTCNLRVQKLCSLAAATVTAKFNFEMTKLCNELYMELPADQLATFDCRVGMYESDEEAVSLLLWRAHECGARSVSDAVYQCIDSEEGAEEATELSTYEQLKWLYEHSLPLNEQQQTGTYLVRRRKVSIADHNRNGQPYARARSRIEHTPGNLLRLCQSGGLFPEDEVCLPRGLSSTHILKEQNEDSTSTETMSSTASF